MPTLDDFWPGIEAAGPDDPGPLLVAADWCAEQDPADGPYQEDGASWSDLEFCFRWCAGNKKRPYKRIELLRPRWRIIRDEYRGRRAVTEGFMRAHPEAVIPFRLFDLCGPYDVCDWETCEFAYEGVALALSEFRRVVHIPDIELPPPKATGIMICGDCGMARRANIPCMVCQMLESRK